MTVTVPQFDLLARLLDAAEVRHRTIAQNLANVNTPGYREMDVSFGDAFARELQRNNDAGAARIVPRLVPGPGGLERPDGNNVDLDRELGSLNRNVLLFHAVNQMLLTRLNMMRSAIAGQ